MESTLGLLGICPAAFAAGTVARFGCAAQTDAMVCTSSRPIDASCDAERAMSFIDKMPTSLPASSTTGRRRTLALRIASAARATSSSARHTAMSWDIDSRTRISESRLPRV
jgi:hypothetical protein